MRKPKASDFANAYEYHAAVKMSRNASKQGRNARANGRGKAFAISPAVED